MPTRGSEATRAETRNRRLFFGLLEKLAKLLLKESYNQFQLKVWRYWIRNNISKMTEDKYSFWKLFLLILPYDSTIVNLALS